MQSFFLVIPERLIYESAKCPTENSILKIELLDECLLLDKSY